MMIKKIGKAKANSEDELWTVVGKGEFFMNPRLVDGTPEMKELRKSARAIFQKRPPSIKQKEKRDTYFQSRDAYKRGMQDLLKKIYTEILEESFTTSVLLCRHRDDDHHRDWRYCLYKGIVYQLDRPGYSDEAIKAQIAELEGVKSLG